MWVWNPKTPQESINTSRRNPPAAVITEDTFTITCYFLTPHDIGRAIQGIYRPCWAPAWKITKSLMDALQGQRPNLLIEGAGLWGWYSTRKTSRMCTERNTTRDKDLKQKLLDMFWFKGEYGLTFPQHRHPTMFFLWSTIRTAWTCMGMLDLGVNAFCSWGGKWAPFLFVFACVH